MSNFSIQFSNPWFLLLLIPAVVFTLIPYFRLSKKYRKTRNRITSIVLHLLVMMFSITLLSGIRFLYTVPNTENEIILLVDVSDTEENSRNNRDEFIENVLENGRYDNYNIGIVTFGFDQVYAVPLTTDVDEIYDSYLVAEMPDTSATNIAAALNYTRNLFKNPNTAKIVLITDGKETDEDAKNVIRSIASQGIKVDTAHIPSAYDQSDVQLIDVTMPDYHITRGTPCVVTLSLESASATEATIKLYDNGKLVATNEEVKIKGDGEQSVAFQHVFESEGLHELTFELETSDADFLSTNNKYCTYYYLEVFNRVLILEHTQGSSVELKNLLNETPAPDGSDAYHIDVKTITAEDLPTTLDGLCEYDQVILNNVAQKEMSEEFQALLQTYVKECGGGLFTVGGTEQGQAHAYDHTDETMPGSIYQQMLPVRVIDYTPPVAVMLIIDRSGSMSTPVDGQTFLSSAINGAMACLDVLDDKDYMGVMTLDSEYEMVLEMTGTTDENRKDIREAISTIDVPQGGTEFTGALIRAGEELWRFKDVTAKRHIIVISDGDPGDPASLYEPVIKQNYELYGITMSVLGIGMTEGSKFHQAMQSAVQAVGPDVPAEKRGDVYLVNSDTLATELKKDLSAPAVTAVEEGPFYPVISNGMSPLLHGVERGEGSNSNKMTVQLGGFFGVEARDSADLVLTGEHEVPIYAQWRYGEGMVGSFMCDLQATSWSQEFMKSENGKRFILNVVNNLMPMNSIRPNEMVIELNEDNYTNRMSVFYTEKLETNEYVEGTITVKTDEGTQTISLNTVGTPSADAACYVTTALSAGNHYSRCDFVAKASGVYVIELTKFKADGTKVATLTEYKDFSYSEEYDVFVEETEKDLKAKLADYAENGNGIAVEDLEDPWIIFEDFVTELNKSFDPRILFMILAIVLFLLDIAVRKFKFKWPHELIREYKNKKSSK